MRIFNLLPAPELRPFIDRLWGWESESSEILRLPTLLPGTGAELYFHHGEPFRFTSQDDIPLAASRGHLFCIRAKPIDLLAGSGIGFIAVRFRIGMLQRFTGIPAEELADSRLDVEDIWGVNGAGLLRHLSYAADQQERIALIQSFLIDRLKPDSADLLLEGAMSMLYRQCSPLSIDALATTLGLGRRQLERRWKIFAGHSPVETRNLSRFQKTIRALLLEPTADTADRALAGGYYDQAHFIHDFRRRMGLSPRQYLEAARTKSHFYNPPLAKNGILQSPNQRS